MVLLTENISMRLTQSHLSLACHIGQVTTFKGSDVIDLFTFFEGESKHKVQFVVERIHPEKMRVDLFVVWSSFPIINLPRLFV